MRRVPVILFLLAAVTAGGIGVRALNDFHRRAVLGEEVEPRKYHAQTRFHIRMSKTAGLKDKAREEEWLTAQVHSLTSWKVLLPVVNRLDLIKTWQLPAEDAVTRICRTMRVERATGQGVVSITVWSDEPHEATDIANAVRDSYEGVRRERMESRYSRVGPGISEPMAARLRLVEAARHGFENVREQCCLPDIPPEKAGELSGRCPELAVAARKYESALQMLATMRDQKTQEHQEEELAWEEEKTVRCVEVLETARTH